MHVQDTISTLIPTIADESVHLTYSKGSGKVMATLIDKLGHPFAIKPEDMPREFRQIKNSEHFRAILQDVYVRASRMSNGDRGLYIHQRGRGGGGDAIIDTTEDPDLVDKTMNIVRQGLKDLRDAKVKENAVILAGRTGAGKSMLGNLLSEVPLKGIRVRFDFRFDADKPIFRISHSNTESCTGIPTVHSPPQRDFTYIDFPGSDDTRKPEQDIANLFFRKEILRSVKQMKIILVVDWTDIDKRGTYLPSTFNDLLQFLGYTDVQDERLANLAESIILVVTHTPPSENSLVREVVGEALKDYVTATYGLKNNAKAVLRKIVEDARWETFSSPSQTGTCTKVSEDRARIAGLLQETKSRYISKSDTTIEAKVSMKYEGKVQTGILTLIATLKKRFAGKILNEVNDYLKRFYTGVEGKKALKKFQKKYKSLVSSEVPRTLFELLKDLQLNSSMFASGLLEEARINDENLKFLIDLLPTKLANQIPYRRDWLGELGLRKPLLKWDETLSTMTAEASWKTVPTADSTPTDPKVRLVLQGYFPRISQIKSVLSNHSNVKEIEIHALHTVIIDEDLSGDSLRGVDVTVIAPKWKVINNRTIDLTGKGGTNSNSHRAADSGTPGTSGADGAPGGSGENGGHFFGLGYAFSGLDHLTVTSNGGKGGRGQAGGAGAAGNDGEDGTVKNTFTDTKEGAHCPGTALNMGWDYVQLPPFHHGNGTYDQELRNNGRDGQVGGNGGRGGAGGLGGQPGTVEFVSLHDPAAVLTSTKLTGNEGDAGDSGAPGIGGRKGRNWKGTWHTGGNPNNGWNGWDLPKFHPASKNDCARASSGTEPPDKNSQGRSQVSIRAFHALEPLYRYREFAISESNPLTLEAIEIFRKLYDQHPSIVGKASVDNFIAECDHMEDFFTQIKDKTKCLPFYLWMSERIQAFTVPGGDPTQIALHQSLYTYILSKICQLNAAMESRLIIDIAGFLKRTEKNIDILKQLDHAVKVAFYEKEYHAHLTSKIKEADVFIKKLNDDIKAADKDIDAQIKKLLKEITELHAKNSANKNDIAAKRDELKAMISRRKILGAISLAAQAIGCCFPPAGPIVAGIVGAGITMINNPRSGIVAVGQALSSYADGISGVLQNNKTPLTTAQNAALTRLKDVAITTAVLDVADNPKTEEEQIQAMDKAIAEIDKQQHQLDSFRNNVNSSLAPSLHELVDGASDAQQALQGKSKIALDFSRLAVKRAFEGVKRQLRESTKAFTAGDGFITIIQQLEEAIKTSANIYDHVQEYEERRILVSYMARLAATTASDPRIDKYKQKVQRNLILEQYARAIAAVRQWAFPFASIYLGDLATLKQFADKKTIDDLMTLVTQHLTLLQDKVMGNSIEVRNSIDAYLWRGKFSEKVTSGPFYIWNFKENKREIVDLLRGEPVVLFADINRTSPEMNAIKFNQIELQIRSTDPIVQAELAKALKGVRVEMRHSGLSYYRHDDKIYQMPNDDGFCIGYQWGNEGDKPEAANEVYSKMKKGEFMLSPYTHWSIKLEGADKLYQQFAGKLDTIQIHLVGKGQYVVAKNAVGKIKKMDQYAGNISFANGAPSIAFSSKPNSQDNKEDNAFAQKDNPQYLYQAIDINNIVQSPSISAELKNFHFIQGMQADHLSKKVDEILTYVNQGKPVLCIYNISNLHWVVFCLLKRSSGQVVTLYKDSYGSDNSDLFQLLKSKSAEFKYHPTAEQVGDTTSCCILALKNMLIMAHEINTDSERFIREFEKQVFCSLPTARALRQGDFARFYSEGLQEFQRLAAVQADLAKKLTVEHQKEADQIVAALRTNAPGFTVQTEDAKSNAARTIVVQIGSEDSNSKNYHYRIEATRDIDEAELQNILSQCEYAWFKDSDYRIENGVFKIFKKIKTS